MDETLRSLQQQVRSAPGDSDAAARLDQALLRAGSQEALRERYRRAFGCREHFESLLPAAKSLEATCKGCDRRVRYLGDPGQVPDHLARGECAGIFRESLDAVFLALAQDARFGSHHDPSAPCLVPSDLAFWDLEKHQAESYEDCALPGPFMHTHRVVSVGREDGVQRIVVSTIEGLDELLADVGFMLNSPVTPFLADPQALDRALARYPQHIAEFDGPNITPPELLELLEGDLREVKLQLGEEDASRLQGTPRHQLAVMLLEDLVHLEGARSLCLAPDKASTLEFVAGSEEEHGPSVPAKVFKGLLNLFGYLAGLKPSDRHPGQLPILVGGEERILLVELEEGPSGQIEVLRLSHPG